MTCESFTAFCSKLGTSERMGLRFSLRSKLSVEYQVLDELKRLDQQIMDADLMPTDD
jgi:hypothetical protein